MQQLAPAQEGKLAQRGLHLCHREHPLANHNLVFSALPHSDACNIHHHTIREWQFIPHTIFKQHVPPTKYVETAALRYHAARTVVLLRNVWAAAEAECESFRARNAWARMTNARKLSDLVRALQSFSSGWRRVSAANPEQFHVITYEELQLQGMRARRATLHSTLQFWNFTNVSVPDVVSFGRTSKNHFMHCGNASCRQDLRALVEQGIEGGGALRSADEGAWQEYERETRREDEMRRQGGRAPSSARCVASQRAAASRAPFDGTTSLAASTPPS